MPDVIQQPAQPEEIVLQSATHPLDSMRRKELERMLVYNGINIESGATASKMRFLAREEMNEGKTLKIPPTGWRLPVQATEPLTPNPRPWAETMGQPTIITSGDKVYAYDGMNIREIRKLVKSRGLKQARGEDRKTLIEKLRGQDAAQRRE